MTLAEELRAEIGLKINMVRDNFCDREEEIIGAMDRCLTRCEIEHASRFCECGAMILSEDDGCQMCEIRHDNLRTVEPLANRLGDWNNPVFDHYESRPSTTEECDNE